MSTNLDIYKRLLSGSIEKLDILNEECEIKEHIALALHKTLDKVKEGKLSPALFPIYISEDIKPEMIHLAYEISIICAYFHTSADLVDDIEDDDLNNPVINSIGKEQSINIANKLVFISQLLISELEIDANKKLELMKLFSNSGNVMCSGQYYDIALTNTPYNNEDSIVDKINLITEKKSGTELACFMSCFNVALGLEHESFYKLGIYIGSLFQVFSDFHDIWGKPFSDDLNVLKNSLAISSLYQDPDFGEEIRLLLAGKNDLKQKQLNLKILAAKTNTGKIFKNYLDKSKANINQILISKPELKIITKLIEDLYFQCDGLLLGINKIRNYFSISETNINSLFDKSINMTLDYLKSKSLECLKNKNLYEDTWEVQRWGFLNEPELFAKTFTPALILETLLDADINITKPLNKILSFTGLKGWHYYSNTDKIPTDTDDLGQLLNLVGRTRDYKNSTLFKIPLKILELNIEDSGKCPTWLSDLDKFTKEEIEDTWFANECIGVMANLYYGLFLFDGYNYRKKILKGIDYILSKFDLSKNTWTGAYYTDKYTFYLVARLINALNIKHRSLDMAKDKLIKEQKLNGSWNNSPQDTASVLLALMTFNDIEQLTLKTGLIYLQDTQQYDGSWEGENLFLCPGKDGRVGYYKHSKITSAFCLRALLQGQKRLKVNNGLGFEIREGAII